MHPRASPLAELSLGLTPLYASYALVCVRSGSLEFDFALRWRELALAHQAESERLAEVHRQEREVLRREQQERYQEELHKFKVIEDPAGGDARKLLAQAGVVQLGGPGMHAQQPAGGGSKRPRQG